MSTPTAVSESPGNLAGNIPGHIEVRGIDYIPPGERHGKPFGLFTLWFSANLSYLYILFGGLLIIFGLTLVQSLLVILAGNLFYVLVGIVATPSECAPGGRELSCSTASSAGR